MATVDQYKVRELTSDMHCWRVDWLGAVTYAERYRRSSQPMIEIQFSQVSDTLTNTNELFSLSTEKWPRTKQIRLPVGLLPLFKIGDFWRGGQLVKSPDYDLAHFDNLSLSRHTSLLIKAGLPREDDSQYYLQIAYHPYHMRHTQSYCVHIRTEKCNLIVPSTELLRFYFGSSSTLVSRLFDAPFGPEKFWLGVENNDSLGTPTIHLAPGISGRSASDIGRIALSKAARSAAELIGNSCIAATARGERAYPKSVFPFDGDTNLVASGKWLPFDGSDRGVFLVFKLLSCSHPFPFARLRYTSERTGSSGRSTSSNSTSGTKDVTSERRFSKMRRESKTIIDEEPDQAKKSRGLALFSEGVQFPDLIWKPISKIEMDTVPTLLLTQKGISIIAGSSVGDTGRTATVQPIDLAGVNTDSTLAGKSNIKSTVSIQVFLNVLSKINESKKFIRVDAVRLDARQRLAHLSTMPQIVDENGEVSSVCLVKTSHLSEGGQGTTRNRCISIGCATSTHANVFFMVPESAEVQPQVVQQVELHLISDVSRSIRTNGDLMAAIALHFSKPWQFGKSEKLGHGVTSIVVSATYDNNTSILQISDQLYYDVASHLVPTLMPDVNVGTKSINSKGAVESIDYLR